MKTKLLIAMMFFNLLFGNAADENDWADKARYARTNMELCSQEADPLRTVLMGNSITEDWFDTHPFFFKAHHLVGRGIGGQVSSQMLVRFRQDVINLNPRVVVINCGTNDIAENNGPYNEDITMDNIQSMAELARAHGIIVVLSSVLPCDRFCWNTSVTDVVSKIGSLNARIAAYAAAQQIPYLDYYSPMATLDGALNPAYTMDGVHPNSDGFLVMEERLIDLLEKLNP